MAIEYGVALSESGLLIEISTLQDGHVIESVQIERAVWPAIVQEVRDRIAARNVLAQAENVVDSVIFGDDP